MASALVTVNAATVVTTSDFSPHVTLITRPVTLTQANTIKVELRGKPGSRLTIRIGREKQPGPTIRATVEPSPNAAGWHKGDVRVTFTCNAGGSGGDDDDDDDRDDGDDDRHRGRDGDGCDRDGREDRSDRARVRLTSGGRGHGDDGRDGHGPRTKKGHDDDDDDGRGSGRIAFCSPPALVTTEGRGQIVTGTVRDRAGRVASVSVTLNIDKTPPVIVPSTAPPPSAHGWHNTDMTVTFQCADALSGVASCTGSQTVSREGAAQPVAGTATDVAGNMANVTATVDIDKILPGITATLSAPANAAGWHRAPVTVTFTCQDGGSGIASCTRPITVLADGADQEIRGEALDRRATRPRPRCG